MPTIIETERFIVTAHDNPHHHRENGGHSKISPKERFADRTEMPVDLATELMILTMIVSEAVTKVMSAKGIPVVRTNYQDNGNWSYKPTMAKEPHIHVHLYVRSKNEKHPQNDPRFQAFPESLVFPPIDDGTNYYQSFEPYTLTDCSEIRGEIIQLAQSNKYSGKIRGL